MATDNLYHMPGMNTVESYLSINHRHGYSEASADRQNHRADKLLKSGRHNSRYMLMLGIINRLPML
jgi:hypothetical protein